VDLQAKDQISRNLFINGNYLIIKDIRIIFSEGEWREMISIPQNIEVLLSVMGNGAAFMRVLIFGEF